MKDLLEIIYNLLTSLQLVGIALTKWPFMCR